MKKKIILSVLLLSVIIMSMGCGLFKEYKLEIPQAETIDYMRLDDGENDIKVTNKKEIKTFINLISSIEHLTTKSASNHDSPLKTKYCIKVTLFNKTEQEESTQTIFFVYSRKGKYYVEQPYNGIYSLSKNEYIEILKVVVK